MAAPENANVQRQVNLTCTIRLIRPGNMANLNPDILGVDINNFEADIAQSFADFITESLNAQDDPAIGIEERFVMRLHSDVNVNMNRALPDGNVFNVNATFTVKYNNEDYDDAIKDADVGLLRDGLIEDFSSRIQNVNNVGFFREVDNIVINMDDEIPLVPIQPVVVHAAPAEQVAQPNENNNNYHGQAMNGGRHRRSRRRRTTQQRRRNTRRQSTRARRGRKN